MTTFVSINEAYDFWMDVGPYRTPVFIGEKGIGKTALLYMAQQDPKNAHFHIPEPVDCTELSEGDTGLPDLDRERGISRMLPNERFGVSLTNQLGIEGSRPVILMLDELFKAPRYIRQMLSPISYGRRVGSLKFPEGSIVGATTNLAVEGVGDTVEPHTADRYVFVYVRKSTYDEWVTWAASKRIHEVVLATLHELPQVFDSFLDYEEGGKHHGKDLEKENPYITNPHIQQDKCVTPRSLHAASDILNHSDRLTDRMLQAALEGAVGAPFAAQLATRLRFGKQLPNYEDIIKDPLNIPMPDNPAVLLLQVFKFINRVRGGNEADAALTFIERMPEEMQQVFTYSIKDSGETIARFASTGNSKLLKMMDRHRKYI